MNVSVILPVIFHEDSHVHLARAAIAIMRAATEVPFELVIVETGSKHLEDEADTFVHRPHLTRYTADFNAGIDASEGDIIVHTGSDVFMAIGWLEEILRVFREYPLAGAVTLACREGGSPAIGPREPQDVVVEGMYGPFFAFQQWLPQLTLGDKHEGPGACAKEMRMDERYDAMCCDNDLIMQIYDAGWRSYRSGRVVVTHLNGATMRSRDGATRERNRELGNRIFAEKWGASPLWMAKMILRGGVIYGREHE